MVSYEFNEEDRNIKFSNLSDKSIQVETVGVIKGTNIEDVNTSKFQLEVYGAWFAPEMNYTAYSSINIYINSEYYFSLSIPNFLTKTNSYKPKIIGIGLNKTGTTSFKDSMAEQGYKPFLEHYGNQYLLQDVHNGNIYSTLSFIESPLYDLYEDLPFSLTGFYKELYKYRPQDYYVLTIRDSVEKWVDSAIKFYKKDLSNINNFKDEKIQITKYHNNTKIKHTKNYLTIQMLNWGIRDNKNLESKLKDVYNRHLDNAVNFFESKLKSNFIIIDVSKENELTKLSNFIGFNTSKNNFLWSNKNKI